MKKLTTILMMLLALWGFSQNAPITFETGEHGADWTWSVFENATNPALEIIANPDPTGANTSATVAKFTALQGGQPWAGVESMEGNLGAFTWDETNRTVKIMVWKSVISDVGIKFDGGAAPNNWSAGEIKVANTLVNQWEELTFDFSNSPNPPDNVGGLKRIAIFPDFSSREQDNVCYFDNITFHPSDVTPVAPTIAAPVPTFNPADVISLYSQPYTDVPVDTWKTDWSQAVYSEEMIDGRLTKKYSNLDFVGIETVANQIDITGMTHFHIHVWSQDFTLFRVKLVDFGPGGNTEHEVPFPDLPQGEWVSLSIPLTDFVNLTGRENIAQIILSGQPVGETTVFVDNVLFYSAQPEPPFAPIDFEAGGYGADWTWSVFENATNPALEIIANPDPTGANTSATVAKFTALQGGQPWAGVESMEGNLGAFTWDETNRTVKIMVWKSVISDVGIKFDGGAAPNNWSAGEIKVANTLVNQWEELTFDFSNSPNPPDNVGGLKRIAIFPDFSSREQDNVCYFDNITFHPSDVTPVAPTMAAPVPTFNPADVISLYSQPYTDVPVDTWKTDWSQAVYSEEMIDGRLTKKYSNLDFVGIETVANQIDITGMTHFHIHVWSPDFTLFRVKLVDFGPGGNTEHEVLFPDLPQGEWVSLSIPLTDFVNLTGRENIAQIILSGQPVGATTVFVDNVLFYNDSGTVEAPNAPIDFEPGGFGADWTWSVFENATNPALEIIDNPDASGINTSSKVAKFTALQAGQPWAGTESAEGHLGEFWWDETNSVVKIMVWKSVISDVGIKFDTGAAPNDWSLGEIKVANTLTNQWEELTFNFSGSQNPPPEFGGLKRISIFPDFDARNQDNVVYFDNITFSAASGGEAPPVPAGLVASNMIGGTPVGAGEMFLACGPNQVGGDVVYKLFYSKTADAPADPTTATEYTFGTTAGDGEGINPFGFVITGLDPSTEYSFWLYQYNTANSLYSDGAATATAVSGGAGPVVPAVPVGLVASNMIGENPVNSGELFLACGPNQVGGDVVYKLYYSKTADAPADPTTATQYTFGTIGGDGDGIGAFGFVLGGLDASTSYTFWLYQYNTASSLYSDGAATAVAVSGGSTSVDTINEETIRVYPNPVVAGTQVRLDGKVKSVDVIDFSGRLVFSIDSSVINTEGLNKGVYILRIHTLDGRIQNQKLLVR